MTANTTQSSLPCKQRAYWQGPMKIPGTCQSSSTGRSLPCPSARAPATSDSSWSPLWCTRNGGTAKERGKTHGGQGSSQIHSGTGGGTGTHHSSHTTAAANATAVPHLGERHGPGDAIGLHGLQGGVGQGRGVPTATSCRVRHMQGHSEGGAAGCRYDCRSQRSGPKDLTERRCSACVGPSVGAQDRWGEGPTVRHEEGARVGVILEGEGGRTRDGKEPASLLPTGTTSTARETDNDLHRDRQLGTHTNTPCHTPDNTHLWGQLVQLLDHVLALGLGPLQDGRLASNGRVLLTDLRGAFVGDVLPLRPCATHKNTTPRKVAPSKHHQRWPNNYLLSFPERACRKQVMGNMCASTATLAPPPPHDRSRTLAPTPTHQPLLQGPKGNDLWV